MDTTSLLDDPMFVNAAQSNYNLLPASPAINAALLPVSLLTANPPIPTDQAGNPRLEGSAFDMGAFGISGSQGAAWNILPSRARPRARPSTRVCRGAAGQSGRFEQQPCHRRDGDFHQSRAAAPVRPSAVQPRQPLDQRERYRDLGGVNANSQQGGYTVTAAVVGAATQRALVSPISP